MRNRYISTRWDEDANCERAPRWMIAKEKRNENRTVLNIFLLNCSKDQAKVLLTLVFSTFLLCIFCSRSVNCWGSGQSYCYSFIVSIADREEKFIASGMRSWKESIGISLQRLCFFLPLSPNEPINYTCLIRCWNFQGSWDYLATLPAKSSNCWTSFNAT